MKQISEKRAVGESWCIRMPTDNPIPTSGPISFSLLKDTFGVTNKSSCNVSFSDFIASSTLSNIGQSSNANSFRLKSLPNPIVYYDVPKIYQASAFETIDTSVTIGSNFAFRRIDTSNIAVSNMTLNVANPRYSFPDEVKVMDISYASNALKYDMSNITVNTSNQHSDMDVVPIVVKLRKRNDIVVTYSSNTSSRASNIDKAIFDISFSTTPLTYNANHRHAISAHHDHNANTVGGNHSHCHLGSHWCDQYAHHANHQGNNSVGGGGGPTQGSTTHQWHHRNAPGTWNHHGGHHNSRGAQGWDSAHHHQHNGHGHYRDQYQGSGHYSHALTYKRVSATPTINVGGTILPPSAFTVTPSYVTGFQGSCITDHNIAQRANDYQGTWTAACTSRWRLTVLPNWTQTSSTSTTKDFALTSGG